MNQGDHAQEADDKDLYQYCNNFYQMLATGFVAALAPQVPKSKWMPEDAEQLADVTTAKAAQTLIGIIERQNREQSLLSNSCCICTPRARCSAIPATWWMRSGPAPRGSRSFTRPKHSWRPIATTASIAERPSPPRRWASMPGIARAAGGRWARTRSSLPSMGR